MKKIFEKLCTSNLGYNLKGEKPTHTRTISPKLGYLGVLGVLGFFGFLRFYSRIYYIALRTRNSYG